MDAFDKARTEVERLHDFIAAWFRGELDKSHFEPDFAEVLHPEFENVQPAGLTLKHDELLNSIQDGHGINPEFQITIEAPRLLGTWQDLILFQYIEYQTGARASAAENRRLSTALFEVKDDKLIWRYLTEIGLPPES